MLDINLNQLDEGQPHWLSKPKTKPKAGRTIAPIFKRDGAYWIDTHELLGDSCAEYGPYSTRDEADEDRGPVVNRIQARRKLKITSYEPAYEISASELKLAVLMLAKMTKDKMRLEKLDADQRKALSLLLYKWKGKLPESTLASLETLKEIFYREAGIDPSWPEADHAFIQWAIRMAG